MVSSFFPQWEFSDHPTRNARRRPRNMSKSASLYMSSHIYIYRCASLYTMLQCIYVYIYTYMYISIFQYINKIHMSVSTDYSCFCLFFASKANVGFDVRNENVPGTLVVLLIFSVTLTDFVRALLRVSFYCDACYLPGLLGLES